MDGTPEEVAGGIVERLERAWNAAAGGGFAAPFTMDADFVDIRGDHHRGRDAIAHGHQGIFDTVYRGSSIRYQVTDARQIADGVIVAHSTGDLSAPSGPMAGEHRARQTLVLVREGHDWRVAAFHNTVVAAGRG